jgi:hypothetical protein
VIPKDVLVEMATEGMTETQVMKLLNEMEMFEENGEDIWEEDPERDQDDEEMAEMDIRERLPMEIMPLVQDIAKESHHEVCEGFFIPKMGGVDSGAGKDGSTGLEIRQTVDDRIEGKKLLKCFYDTSTGLLQEQPIIVHCWRTKALVCLSRMNMRVYVVWAAGT